MHDDAAPWLSDAEQSVWRRWIYTQAQLHSQLARRLAAESGLSMSDYEVLVMLSEAPGGRLRMATLAEGLRWDRSRLSHHIRRMETRGVVARTDCPEDGRGSFVGITRAGRTTIEAAAPGHVRAVRELFIEPLGEDGLALLGEALAKLPTPADETDAVTAAELTRAT
jgi:DNA-binding MarR family transcriptional regulator